MTARMSNLIWACAVCVVLVALLANFVMIDTPATLPASHESPHETREVSKPAAQPRDAEEKNIARAGHVLFSRLKNAQEQIAKAGKPRLHLCEMLRNICKRVTTAGETQMLAEHMCMKTQLEVLLPESSLLSRIRAQVIPLLHFVC